MNCAEFKGRSKSTETINVGRFEGSGWSECKWRKVGENEDSEESDM